MSSLIRRIFALRLARNQFRSKLLQTSAKDNEPTKRVGESTSGGGEKSDEQSALEENVYVNPITGERGGPRGPEPTRYGDWERKGRVSDF